MSNPGGEAVRPVEIGGGSENRIHERIESEERKHHRIISEAFNLLKEGPLSLEEVRDVIRAELAYCEGMQREASRRMQGFSDGPDSINAGIDFSMFSERRGMLNDTWREINDPGKSATERPLLHEYLRSLSVRVSYYRAVGAGNAEKVKENIHATIKELCPSPDQG